MPGPLLDLTVTQPAPQSPIQTIGALANLRGLQSDIALRNQQAATARANEQDIQAQAEQRNRDIADQNTIQERMKNPDFAHSVSSWDGTSAFPLDGLVSPKAARDAQTAILAQQKERATLTPLQRTENDAKHKAIGDTLNGLALDETGKKRSDADIAALAPGAFSQLVRDGQLKAENVPTVRSWDDLNKFAVYNRYVQGLGDAASALQVAAGKPGYQEAQTAAELAAAADKNASAADTNALLPGKVQAQATENDQKARTLAGTSPTGITAEQQAQNASAAMTARAAAENAATNAKRFAAEFGGDAVKGWVAQVAANPDTANTVPATLRNSVVQEFTKTTGLPFPKPLAGTAVDQERAASNVIQKIPRIEQLMADPEISNTIGPILGRLGDLSQTVGTAYGLSPSAAAKAQELRTLLNYTVMGEGKALLGGRMPQQLIQQLEDTSVRNTMDPALAKGAIKAMSGAANDVLDSTYKQRFGPAAVRPAANAAAPAAAAFSIPAGAKVQQNPANQKYRYSTDGGKTWVVQP